MVAPSEFAKFRQMDLLHPRCGKFCQALVGWHRFLSIGLSDEIDGTSARAWNIGGFPRPYSETRPSSHPAKQSPGNRDAEVSERGGGRERGGIFRWVKLREMRGAGYFQQAGCA